jgi:malonyl CoA-acyl carrier protein transacylase
MTGGVPPTTILDDEFATLWYHPDEKVVHHKIHKFLVAGVFERLLNTGAELLEKHGAVKWLSDDRNNVVLSPEDRQWSDTVWAPRVLKLGFRYWAIVVPGQAVAELQMKQLKAKRQKQGLVVEMFETPEQAMAWLRSV